jgi:5-methylcytosine-specific restriction endonuclease McrA
LTKYIKHRSRTLRANRSRIYKRDGYECVYCGSKKELTLDHVLPKSRGGTNEWTNLVTSCMKCNRKKADRTPDEAKMNMKSKPYIPQIMYEDKTLLNVWNAYQESFIS